MKRIWIRAISAAMASLTVLLTFPLTAAASGQSMEEVRISISFSGSSASWTEEQRARILAGAAVLEQGMLDMQETISVSSLNLTREELKAAFQYAMDSCPELFHVDFVYNLYASSAGYVTKVVPTYRTTAEEKETMLFQMKDAASEFFLSVSEETNELGIAFLAHDYICATVAYPEKSDLAYHHTAYGALVNGSAVCQGYALAYIYLLNYFDIAASYVSNADHGWVKVKLDGEWYHVDPTWDDPINDKYGYAAKQYFLLTDSEIGVDHLGYSDFAGTVADSNVYADFPLRGSVDNVAYRNGYFFFPYSSLLVATKTPEDLSSYQYLFSDYFYDVSATAVYDGKIWFINGTNLYSFSFAEHTYPTTVTAVKLEANLADLGMNMLTYDPAIAMTISEDGKIGITDFAHRLYSFFAEDLRPSNVYFSYGFYYTVTDGTATIMDYIGSSVRLHIPSQLGGVPVTAIAAYACDNLPSLQTILIRDNIVSIETTAFPQSSAATVYGFENTVAQSFAAARNISFSALPEGYKPGDANRDTLVNNKDVTVLLRNLAQWGNDIDMLASDVNGDGNVTNRDAIYLLRYLAGWKNIILM